MRINTFYIVVIVLLFQGCTGFKFVSLDYTGIAFLKNKNEIFVRIDDYSHKSKITEVIVTEDKEEIITSSHDKTIRIWDVKTGLEKRKILGEIGRKGNFGRILTMALTKDKKYLFVGGFLALGGGVDNEKVGNIRVYNYKSGKLVHILSGHADVVHDLDISPDGKFLLSVNGHEAFIWELNTFKIINKIKATTAYLSQGKFANDRNDILISDTMSNIQLLDFNTKLKKEINLSKKKNYLINFAVSRELIVLALYKSVKILDKKLNLLKSIPTRKPNGRVSISNNSRYIAVGGDGYPAVPEVSFAFSSKVKIYDTKKNFKKIVSFTNHITSTNALSFIDNNTIVSTGGLNKGYFYLEF